MFSGISVEKAILLVSSDQTFLINFNRLFSLKCHTEIKHEGPIYANPRLIKTEPKSVGDHEGS